MSARAGLVTLIVNEPVEVAPSVPCVAANSSAGASTVLHANAPTSKDVLRTLFIVFIPISVQYWEMRERQTLISPYIRKEQFKCQPP